MSPVAMGLDLLLAVLLVAATGVGLRLNGRLKALRNGQAGFIKAVAELDAAAARTQSSLAALRAGGEEAHDALLTRIETARGLIARLDAATEAAEKAATALPQVARPSRAMTPVQAPLSRGETRLHPRVELAARPERTPSSLASQAVRRAGARGLDDELFEVAEPAMAVSSEAEAAAAVARRFLHQRR